MNIHSLVFPQPRRRALHRRASCLLMLASVIALACTGAEEGASPQRAVVGEKALMASVIEPAADIYWAGVGEIVTAEGTEQIRPESNEDWLALRNAAVILAESGNLLMVGRRARDQGDWQKWAIELTDAGEAAMRAAEARDEQAVFDVGERVYFSCRGCHETYWPESIL